MTITIRSQQEGEESFVVGCVCPPKHMEDMDEVVLNGTVHDLYEAYRKEVPQPDSDSQFALWLVQYCGWSWSDGKFMEVTIEP